MDLVEREQRIVSLLLGIYSNREFQEELDATAKTIASILKSLLVENGKDFDLISKNSVRDLKFFSLVYRVKEEDSLREKFYRSNLLHKKFQDFRNANRSMISGNRSRIKGILRGCDDLIGVKILTDLNEDCKKVLSLLRDSEATLKSDGLTLNQVDLESQPTIMTNGLEIYKLRADYKATAFELQIKSKIVSAWGDMEHSIFYKDYFVSPVRESTQATMNHIGKMLFQIDDFLLSVREANKSYEMRSDVTAFLSWFDKNYSERIASKLGSTHYKIDLFSEALFHVRTTHGIPDRFARRDLQFSHFTRRSGIPLHKHYISIRNSSYDLKIFESIVFSWLWTPAQIKRSNLDLKFKRFFEVIVSFLCDGIMKKLAGYEKLSLSREMHSYLEKTLEYGPDANALLSPKHYVEHLIFKVFLKSECDGFGADVTKSKGYFELLDMVFIVRRFNGNCNDLIHGRNIQQDERQKLSELLDRVGKEVRLKGRTEFERERNYISEIINLLSVTENEQH